MVAAVCMRRYEMALADVLGTNLFNVTFLVGMIERRDRTVMRMGVDSLCALVIYAGGVAVMFQLR